MENFLSFQEKNEAKTNRNISILYIFSMIGSAVIFLLDLSLPLGLSVSMTYTLVVLLSLWLPSLKSGLLMATLCSVLIIVGALFSPQGGDVLKGIVNRGLALFVIWSTAVIIFQKKLLEQRQKKIELEREKALRQIKVLSGLLPICASCKKIRDDQGYWSQIESYLEKHSEAEFSHSMCPECSDKLYGDKDWYIKMKQKKGIE